MSYQVDARLQRLLGGDHLVSLRKRLRQRFERAPADGLVERIRMADLSAEEHSALALLLGRSSRFTNSLQIDVQAVDEVLQSSGIASSLRNALEMLDGPIVHLATARNTLQGLWSDVINGCDHPDLASLLEASGGVSLLKRLSRQQPTAAKLLCRRAEAVLSRLPAKGITRSQLAAEVLGDAHALDDGQGAATLVLAVWRKLSPSNDSQEHSGSPEDVWGSGSQEIASEERARDTWARAGVLVNELARPALFVNLPTSEGTNHGHPAGEPSYASLRLLLRSPPEWDVKGRIVYICENPNLLAIAADYWGAACAPLVCTDGMPSAAQRCLLSQLASGGANLRYHGDFDWPGLHIGNQVMREHGAEPWRFSAADYTVAAKVVSRLGPPLSDRLVEAIWDKQLTEVMYEQRVAIAEEAIATKLLDDLGK
jgi:uncharacterized protein (TIGR02679 family)